MLYSLLVCSVFAWSQADGNTETLSGVVVDAQTNEPIVSASVFLTDYRTGGNTDVNGKFSFKVRNFVSTKKTTMRVSIIGYKAEFVTLSSGKYTNLKIKLRSESQNLKEVEIKKQRYKRKGNPALELLEKVVENKKRNQIKSQDYYQNDKYEKIQFALNKITPEFQKKRIFKKFQFVFDNIDSLNGEQCLPIYLKETMYRDVFRKSPRENKEIVKAHKAVSLNGFDDRSIEDNIKYLYQDINIYDNQVPLLSNQILSPLAGNATTFYRYYIIDTLKVGPDSCIRMFFAPKNKEDLLFQGNLYIAKDSTYAIKKIEFGLSKQININWVSDVKVVQEFQKINNVWTQGSELISMKFGLSKNSRGIIGQKVDTYYNYAFTPQPEDTINNKKVLAVDDARLKKSDEYWAANRPVQLTKSEAGIYQTMDSLNRMPIIRRTIDLMTMLFMGYKQMGWCEIGPINTFYQYNSVEGMRLRFGGRTTDTFSKKLTLESYGAYGFLDERWKYYLGGAWSLTDHNSQKFPVKTIRMSYQQETQFPGQEMKFLMEDNFLLSIKRGETDKLFYNKIFKFEHLNEFENHFSYLVGYKYTSMEPGGNLFYNYTDYSARTNDVAKINVPEFYMTLRYAPNESFYQGKTFRLPNYNKYPVFELRYNAGSKLWGNDYNYQTLRLNIRKRIYMSVFGFSDMVWEAGKIFGKVPYPLLHIPQANQSYSYQIESYNLMNFLEFATDQYTSIMFDHAFNGFFFNKVPLLKKTGLREFASIKALYGTITDRNDPAKTSGLFKLPVDANGVASTYTLQKEPYVEGSVGIGNILRVIRVDLVKRFTYVNNPNISTWGFRMRFRLDF